VGHGAGTTYSFSTKLIAGTTGKGTTIEPARSCTLIA
jgi:hypothetical protein